MKSRKILTAIGKISDDLIEDADLTSNKKQHPMLWKIVSIAACLCLLITGASVVGNLIGVEDDLAFNPLVITVYAKSDDGTIVPTVLKLGEKVKMYPQASKMWDDFEGYAMSLALFDAKYVSTWAVDENWETIRYPGDSLQYNFDEDCNWALTEGDDIWWVYLDRDGKVIPPGADEFLSPRLRGSEILWRPNTKGHNREIIAVFDDNYNLLTVYYLEITEENNEYYAEIVKIDNKIPAALY